MPGFDWPALMRAGIRGLGLSPDEFWALTPAELQVLLGEGAGGRPMGRSRLGELMAAFPDKGAETKERAME
ncbi:rcc01693 family protein [Pacificoceanicola onchidii]|uniref:rcc01693 family protein n=1 Tax=Pacificoceanicola onchidii TaxID=2562685 RepID=UPI0010A66FAC|nr:rcc01693 family protein [Pacificoceanicola onchidii]